MKKIIEDKRILTFYIIVIFGLMFGFTYALSDNSLAINIGTALIGVDEDAYGDTSFYNSDVELVPILDSEVDDRLDNVIKIDFMVGGASSNTTDDVIYDIAIADLELNCALLSPYMKWKLLKDGVELSSGSLDYRFDTIVDGRLVLTTIQEDLPEYSSSKTGYHSYTFYMWLSDSCQSTSISSCVGKVDQSSLIGKSFSGKVEVELYTGSKKELVRNPRTTIDSTTCDNNFTVSLINKPNLDNGNLIPVYYDESDDVWRKADSNNTNNSWYDYENKMWANAVIMRPNSIRDVSGNGNHAVMHGATMVDDWATTDGVDDYIDLGLKNYKFSAGFSLGIEVVFNSLNASTYQETVFFGNVENGGFGLILDTSDRISFIIGNSNTSSFSVITSNVVPTIGEDYVIIVTYDNAVAKLYINGELVGSISVTDVFLTSGSPLVIGGNPLIDANSGLVYAVNNPLSVTVGEVLVYDRALSEIEAADIWNYGDFLVVDWDDMLLYYYDDVPGDFMVDDVVSNSNGAGVLGFYVWIPRYKYRVWNITRQAGTEDTYAYPAYSNGIQIEFEKGTRSTGNVECTYDATTTEGSGFSDKCYYNGASTSVVSTDSNSSYADAWYTHPAFAFGDKEIEGFWVGKFETAGDETAPTILPDARALTNLGVSKSFVASKLFQNYLSSDVDAHMLTNLEWGAVAYFTHSQYGLCDGTTCNGIYINNAIGMFTGRSGGAISGKSYYNSYGNYDYIGNVIDAYGNVSNADRDVTKLASTTRNVTGIYDLSGGAAEYVMGNMNDNNNKFNTYTGGSSWQGTQWYDTTNKALKSQYYNSYSYGVYKYHAWAYNRSRLGDSTAEVLSHTSTAGTWQPGSDIKGAYSDFLTAGENPSNYWFIRGGRYDSIYSSVFEFNGEGGIAAESYGFRCSIS